MNLIIDIGNSAAKLAVFEQGDIKEVLRCSNQTLEGLELFCAKYPIKRGIVSSVITLSDELRERLQRLPFDMLEFTYKTPVPIRNLYQTPETLGADRLAAAIAAYTAQPGYPLLIIDAGTCITYDFVDEHGQYQGGNISPGIDMRFKALHAFTGKLPEVNGDGEIPMHGKSTETAIRSGVIKGVEYEIGGYIGQHRKNYPSLLVFLTGGNGFSFDTNVKNGIFADGFLVLKGLNRILEYNDTI